MFNYPIKRTELKSLEEIKKYSYLTSKISSQPRVWCQENDQIAYTDKSGNIYVTPYRTEIQSVLSDAGYKEGTLYVPVFDGGIIPNHYRWLKKIALQENWATTHFQAIEIAAARDIKPVELSTDEKFHVCEISSCYNDKENSSIYFPMANLWLLNGEKDNIATYIIINKKTLLICDEYARTFLIRVKSVINDIVNELIDAGYRHNPTPAKYVSFYEPEEEKPQKPKLPSDSIV